MQKNKQKLGFFGPMKSFGSAETSFEKIKDGGFKATIVHDVMKGVKIDHLIWWFENIDKVTTFNGKGFDGHEIDSYKLWHPHDHIKVYWKKKKLNHEGKIMPGSKLAIKETFQGFLVNESVTVSQFDRDAFNFEMCFLGIKVAHLLHFYKETEEGVIYKTEMLVKCNAPIIGKLLTWLACNLIASEKRIKAWMLHNIEESGESEKFIPQLFENTISKDIKSI
tara:strand:- start:118 stop:783 length:666 start_codon:yes stop_codon:yes gene_type:complete